MSEKEKNDFVNRCTAAARNLVNDQNDAVEICLGRFLQVDSEGRETVFVQIEMDSGDRVAKLEAENALLKAEVERLKKKNKPKQ